MAPAPGGRAVADPRVLRRVVIASSAGTIIEWYDFALYGVASALVFARLFFPNQSGVGGTLASFAVFAIAFFVRPVGGIIAAHVGDRIGRKPVLIATVTLMGASTVLIGLLPTYAVIGEWAPVLLVSTRVLQGLGAGAEFSGAVTTVAEYAPSDRLAYYTSWSQACVGLATAVATGLFALLSLLPPEVVLGWAWRVPFLLSLPIFGVAVFIRRRIEETPEFQQTKAEMAASDVPPEKVPLWTALRNAPRELVIGVLCGSGINVVAYLINTFALSYAVKTLGVTSAVATVSVVVGVGSSFLTVPLFGRLADRVGYRKVFMGGAIFLALYAYPYFQLLDTRNPALIVVAMTIGFGIGQASMIGSQSAFLAELFPTHYRFTGIAVSREISVMALGGTTPYIATAIVAANGGSPTGVVLFMVAALLVTVVSLALARRRTDTPVETTASAPRTV